MHIDLLLGALRKIKLQNPDAHVHFEVEGDPIPLFSVKPFKTLNSEGKVITDVILNIESSDAS